MTQHRTREQQIAALAGEVGPEKIHGPEKVRRMWATAHIAEAEDRVRTAPQDENERLRTALEPFAETADYFDADGNDFQRDYEDDFTLGGEDADCVLHALNVGHLRAARVALAATTQSPADPSDRERLAQVPGIVVQKVSELPDRTSPDDAPDMLAVTTDELANIICATIGEAMDCESDAIEAQQEDPIDMAYRRGVQNGRAAGITIGRHQAQTVISAAITMALSELRVAAELMGDNLLAFDPWPEMDALLAALDMVRAGWRDSAVQMPKSSDSICDVLAERERQNVVEGWVPELPPASAVIAKE